MEKVNIYSWFFKNFLSLLPFNGGEGQVIISAILFVALTTCIIWIGLLFVKNRVAKFILEFAKKFHPELEELFQTLIQHTKNLTLIAASVYSSLILLGQEQAGKLGNIVTKITLIILLWQIGRWGSLIVEFGIKQYAKKKFKNDTSQLATMAAIIFLLRLFVWVAILLLILDNIGINVTALVAGLGIGGVAVALAIQNILGDVFASLSIVMDRPFLVGDFIIVDNLMGTVEYIGLKTTRVRSLSGEQLIFPNGDLLKSRIRNFKRMRERRIVFHFGVIYQTPLEKLKAIPQIVKKIIENCPHTRFERAHFKAYGASSLDFEVVYWMTTPDYLTYMDTQQKINLELFQTFTQEGIEFAYPTQSLFIEKWPSSPSSLPQPPS